MGLSRKDIMKLCLCSINYGKGITIDSTICSDGSTYYEVSAKHNFKNDNEIRIVCFGIYDFICEFVSYIKEHDIEYDYVLSKQTLKAILDDKTREFLIRHEIKRKEKVEKYLEETKYITEWCEKNNPCPNCKINKKDHWDNIHYNCEENHNMQCQILKEYRSKVEGMYKEYKESKNK